MQKTKIEWCDYTINPVKGMCPNTACPLWEKGCYARAMYHRFKWDPEIRIDLDVFNDIHNIKEPSRIFVGSMIDLFHPDVSGWEDDILKNCEILPQHTFIFLTKCPENLIKWAPFPDNCWVGVSATNHEQYKNGLRYLREIEASVRFFSFEPLLHKINVDYGILDWLIIGQQTPVRSSTMPRVEWIQEIVQAADQADIPVFLKDNLKMRLPFRQHYKDDFHGKCWSLRQEFPKVPEKVR